MDINSVISRPLARNSGDNSTLTTQTPITPPAENSMKRQRTTRTIERCNIDLRLSNDVLTLVDGVWLIPKSCNSCRERRLFCDRKHPCTQCTSKGKECARPSGLAQAKGFSRRIAYNTGPSKRIRTDHEGPTPVSPNTSDGEHQDKGQASTSDNGPPSLFPHSVADPNRENPVCSLFPLASHPAPVAPIAYGIALVTRIMTSRVVRHIYESECPTLALFLERVRKLWNLTTIERIAHVQIVVTVRVDTIPVVQVIDISLDRLPQWEMAMELARRNDNAVVVIVEIS